MFIQLKKRGFKDEKMKEGIKIAGEIMLKSSLKWVLIVLLGEFFTLFSFLVAFFWNMDLMFEEGHWFSNFFYGLLYENVPALLLVFGAPIFSIVYIVMAQKVVIKNAIYMLVTSKAGEYVVQLLGTTIEKITNMPGWGAQLMDKAVMKAKVLHEIKENPEASGIQRSIIRYGFRKINMDDVNFQDESLDLSTIVGDKFRDFFAEMVKPTMIYFWILLLVQFILLISSLFFR